MTPQRPSTVSRIAAACSGVVSRRPAPMHCCTAASHPAREKTKKIAGSSASRSSTSTTANLGGHHDHRCVAVEGGVPGEQADLLCTVPPREVRVLLVAQRRYRRGVEGLLTPAQGQMDGKL